MVEQVNLQNTELENDDLWSIREQYQLEDIDYLILKYLLVLYYIKILILYIFFN
mgnify:CR=1 FL=1